MENYTKQFKQPLLIVKIKKTLKNYNICFWVLQIRLKIKLTKIIRNPLLMVKIARLNFLHLSLLQIWWVLMLLHFRMNLCNKLMEKQTILVTIIFLGFKNPCLFNKDLLLPQIIKMDSRLINLTSHNKDKPK